MQSDQHEVHLDAYKARAGTTPGVVRWMLAIGLTVTIVGMAVIWLVQGGS